MAGWLMGMATRSRFVAALLLLSVQLVVVGALGGNVCGQVPSQVPNEDVRAPVIDRSSIEAEIAGADQLYRAGKFAEAEASYQSLLKNNPKLAPAQVGLVRSMLRQQKLDEALDAVNAALAAQSNSAALLAAKGDVQFRLAAMSDAELSYLAAKKLDPKEVHAYLGLWGVYTAYSMYRVAYGELQIAHQIAPDNIDVQRVWLDTLPRKQKLAAIESYLANFHPEDEEETLRLAEHLEFLKATIGKPIHTCKLVSKVEQTETTLERLRPNDGRRRWRTDLSEGISLAAKLNDQDIHLQLDTGASGIIVSHRVADNAGLTRISAVHFGGIGDRGVQSGYRALADDIRIGELEFHGCLVTVINQGAVTNHEDGLIGADVFASYLVDIDLPGMRLKLSPLPKRPEEKVAPKSLNSEGEDQATAEQEPDSATEANSNQQKSSAPGETIPPASQSKDSLPDFRPDFLPKDRYIAPEMLNWTKVFRFGHMILVPTNVNDSKPMLFGLDTGSASNLLSLRAGRQIGKVGPDNFLRVRGMSGKVNQVYSTRATLRFGGLRVPNQNIVTIDLASISSQTGTEFSGFLGFEMLKLLDIKLDYRDGLVDFEYDRKRARP